MVTLKIFYCIIQLRKAVSSFCGYGNRDPHFLKKEQRQKGISFGSFNKELTYLR